MINFLFTALFFLTPLTMNLANSEFFEVPKMYIVYLLTLIIGTVHLIRYFQGKSTLFRKTPLNIFFIIFYISQAISAFFSVDSHTSFFGYYSRLNGGLLSLTCYLILYFVLSVHLTPKLKSNIIDASLLVGFFISSYGILEHFGIDKGFWVQDVQARVFSTLGQPNWLAAYLGILLPLSLDRLLNTKSNILRILYFLLTTNLFTCILFTKSKSGILAVIITLTLYTLIYLYKKQFRPSRVHFLYLLSLVFLSLYINNPIKDYLFPSPIQPPAATDRSVLNITPSEDIRKIVWRGSIDLWRQFPIFGTGPETFAYTYYWTRPASHNLTSEWNFIYNKAHNEYLNYLATTGTFGSVTYLLLIISILYLLRSELALLISFLSILITNFFGFSVVITSLYFFLIPSLVISPTTTNLAKPKNRLFIVATIFFSLMIASKIFYFYLSDIAFHNPTISKLEYALIQRPNEPGYLSKYAQLLAEKSVTTKDKASIPTIIKALNAAITISPFNLNLWKERAQTYYYLAQLDSQYYVYALDALTKATRLAPTDASSFYLLGKFYQNISKNDEAIKNYQQAYKLKSNYDYATFSLGEIYFQQKEFVKAKDMFTKTLELAPTNQQAKEYLVKIPN